VAAPGTETACGGREEFICVASDQEMSEVMRQKVLAGLKQIKPLRAVIRAARNFLELYWRQTWILEGTERWSGEPLKIFFSGQLENRNFLVDLMFDPLCRIADAGKNWFWFAFRFAWRHYPDAGIRIVQIGHRWERLFRAPERFFIPSWVKGEIDIPKDIAWYKRHHLLRGDLRKIRQNGYSYEVTNDLSAVDFFFNDMYVPYVRGIYGDHAFMESLDKVKQKWARCELLLITQAGEVVAGNVLRHEENGRAAAWILGVKEGRRDLVEQGALGALYYFNLQHLASRGYVVLDIGDSRPFLRDGVLRYKKKWGMRITGSYLAEPGFMLEYDGADSGARAFLGNNPFIADFNRKLVSVLFRKCGESGPDIETEQFYLQHWYPGIAELHVYGFMEGSSRALRVRQSLTASPTMVNEPRP
jgi:hypothetical protein